MKEIQFKISVGNPEVDDEEYLYKMTKDLKKELNRIDLQVNMEKGEKVLNTRGDPITIGTLIITAFTSGAISALINLIGNWIKRKKTKFKFSFSKTTPDGNIAEETVEVDNANINSKKISDLFEKLANRLDE